MEVELQHCVTPCLNPASRWSGNHEAMQQSPSPSGPTKTGDPSRGDTMEPRITELETHLEYIHRDLGEVRGDVKSIKARLAYIAGGTTVLGMLLSWLANHRLDQILRLLAP
ncbi:hypothetical protein [Pseudomonas agarici]|nr:hypothetical protein [Pseudomonas agarici]